MAANDTRVVQSEGSNKTMPATPDSPKPGGDAAIGTRQASDMVTKSGPMQMPNTVSVGHVTGAPIAPVAPALAGLPGHDFPAPVGNPQAPTPSISSGGPPGHDDRP